MSSPKTPQDPDNTIAFQGELGAYSHMACQACYPTMAVMPCPSFDEALEAVERGWARLAMIPIENSTAGRVADIHHLLPQSGLFIVAEHFERIRHCLLAPQTATDESLTRIHSHVQALGQCHRMLQEMGLEPHAFSDTAAAARYASEQNDPAVGAIASRLAAEVYGLKVMRSNIQDRGENTTRFVVLARQPVAPAEVAAPTMTTFTFEVRNVPAALFKALGGFATNGVNMTKLESYQEGDAFTATMFYADIEGHEGQANVARAMEELRFHTKRVRLFGTYHQERPRG